MAEEPLKHKNGIQSSVTVIAADWQPCMGSETEALTYFLGSFSAGVASSSCSSPVAVVSPAGVAVRDEEELLCVFPVVVVESFLLRSATNEGESRTCFHTS